MIPTPRHELSNKQVLWGFGGFLVVVLLLGLVPGINGNNAGSTLIPSQPTSTLSPTYGPSESTYTTPYPSSTPMPTPAPAAPPTPTPTPIPTPQPSVTLKSFDAIQNGMTLHQVQALLGSGTLVSESNDLGISETVYQWLAPGDVAAITVGFQNNSVIDKTQFGLT